MKEITIKCRALMVGDWCCDKHGFPMQITNVGDDYAYATFEGNEGDPWEFDDNEGYEPQPIILTPEILEENGWKRTEFKSDIEYEHDGAFMFLIVEGNYVRCIIADYNRFGKINSLGVSFAELCHLHYVHELQHALRLCGLNELADNFKV